MCVLYIQLPIYTGMQVYRYTGIQVYRYIHVGIQVGIELYGVGWDILQVHCIVRLTGEDRYRCSEGINLYMSIHTPVPV